SHVWLQPRISRRAAAVHIAECDCCHSPRQIKDIESPAHYGEPRRKSVLWRPRQNIWRVSPDGREHKPGLRLNMFSNYLRPPVQLLMLAETSLVFLAVFVGVVVRFHGDVDSFSSVHGSIWPKAFV